MYAEVLGSGGRKYTDICNLLWNGSKNIKMDWQMDRGRHEYMMKFSKILAVNVGDGYWDVTLILSTLLLKFS